MIKRTLFLACILSIPAHAHHQAFIESNFIKEVGNSYVFSTYDRFHDIYSWSVLVSDPESTLMPPLSLTLSYSEVADFSASFRFSIELEIDLNGTLEYYLDDEEASTLDVVITPVNLRLALADFDRDQFITFMEELEDASEITFAVGDKKETLQLDGISEIVTEYRRVLTEAYIIELEPDEIEDEEAETPVRIEGDVHPTNDEG